MSCLVLCPRELRVPLSGMLEMYGTSLEPMIAHTSTLTSTHVFTLMFLFFEAHCVVQGFSCTSLVLGKESKKWEEKFSCLEGSLLPYPSWGVAYSFLLWPQAVCWEFWCFYVCCSTLDTLVHAQQQSSRPFLTQPLHLAGLLLVTPKRKL